ncbi:hypothetical protein KI387_030209, partial [Taxus chinensis]
MMDTQEELSFMSEACEDSCIDEIEYEWSSEGEEEPKREVKKNVVKSIQRKFLDTNVMIQSDFLCIKGILAKKSMMDEISIKDSKIEEQKRMHLEAFKHEGMQQ